MPEWDFYTEDQNYRQNASYDQTELARGGETILLNGYKNSTIATPPSINNLCKIASQERSTMLANICLGSLFIDLNLKE